MADKDENKDQRPDVAKDDQNTPREKAKESWHQPEETLTDSAAPSPGAEKRSRISD